MRYFSLIICTTLLCTSLFSQAPKYSNEFLSIGVGARALGMSNSNVANVDDVTSGYWNPAGLLKVKPDFQLGLMHAEYFAGIAKYDYGAFTTKLDSNNAIGLSLIRFGVDDIPNTTELIDNDGNIDYNRITSFSAADYGILFSYARRMPVKGLTVGGNFKIIHRVVGSFAKAWGFGIDAAAQYQVEKWQFGATLRDVTSTFNAWSYSLSDRTIEVFQATGNEIPQNSIELTLPKLILGGARKFELPKKFSILAELNLDLTFDGMRNVLIKSDPISIDPHFGFEAGYNDLVFLRGGIGNFQTITDIEGFNVITFQPNFGIGLKLKGLAIDYALTNIGNQSIGLFSNIFSLKIDINKAPK